jgi:hypothetical protein
MRIRTAPGQPGAPGSACVNGHTEKAAETSSPTRSERRMRRSRRWVQLRETASADPSAPTTSDASGVPSDPDTSPNGDAEHGDDRCSTGAPDGGPTVTEHDPEHEDTREIPADEAPRPAAARRADPLALFLELAMMPARMAVTGTTETLKLLAPDPDVTTASARGTTTRQVGEKQQHVEE